MHRPFGQKTLLLAGLLALMAAAALTPSPALAAWTIESLGEGGETVKYGEVFSLALDSNGKVHIAYVNSSDQLRYATNASGTWVYQTPYSPWYWDAVIAVDSNNKMHIIGGNNMRTYATNASGSWVVTTIGSSFNWDYTTTEMRANIAVDSNNKLYKGYTSYNFGSGPDIRYGSNVWGFWSYNNIDTSLVSGGEPVPIAIDSIDKIHVTYYDRYNCDLKYATNASGSWVVAIADNSACADGPSMSIDSNNKAHIGYESSGWGHVKYLTNASGSWVSTTLDTSAYPLAIDRGIFIATDSNNKVHLSYANNFNYLRYATNASGSWVYTTVDTGSFSRTAIAVGSATNVHIIYAPTGSPYTLKHVTNEGAPPPPPPPTVNLSAFPTTINSGESTTLSWTTTDATSCDDVPLPEWISGPVGTSGSEIEWPTATTTYTISCTGPGGTTQQSTTVTVTAPPTCGDLDTSFDGDGVITNNPSSSSDAVNAIAIDASSIYMAGYDYSPGNQQWRIEKRNITTGALISGFGTSGVVTFNPSSGTDGANALALDGSGVYIAGWDSSPGNTQWHIEKRDITTGALISGFGTSGVVTFNPSSGADGANALALDGSSIYIVGLDVSPGNSQWRIEKRRLDTGVLCTAANCGTAFDTDGIVLSNPGAFLADQPYAIAIDSSYMYVVGFDSNTATSNYQWRIEKRRLDTGVLCTTANCGTAFDTDGVVTTDPSVSTDIADAIAIDSSYMYVVGFDSSPGYSQGRIEKRRLDTGALEVAFDADGIVTVSPCAANASTYAIVVDSNAIYVSGYDSCGSGSQWRLEKRDRVSGALIFSFGTNGVVTSDPSASSDGAYDIKIDSSGIYVAGYDSAPGNTQWRIEKRKLTCAGAPPLPTINLTATPPTINSGETSTLDWTSTDAASCAAFSPAGWITADGGDGVGGTCENSSPYLNGCQVVQPSSTTTYTIECQNAVGDPAQQSVTVTVNAAPSGNDCGMRVYDGTSTIILDCETPASTTSLRIDNNGTTSGIKLVDPADPNASRIRIAVPDGGGGTVIKALRKQ